MSDRPTPDQIRQAAEAARTMGLTTEERVTSPLKGEKHRGEAIDWVVEKYGHHQLVSIIFEEEDEDGFNVFTVCYNKKPTTE